MEKNKVVTAKKAKDAKGIKKPKPPKQKREKRSARKQRIMYEKALKKARPERALSLIAIGLGVASAVLQAVIDQKNQDEQK